MSAPRVFEHAGAFALCQDHKRPFMVRATLSALFSARLTRVREMRQLIVSGASRSESDAYWTY